MQTLTDAPSIIPSCGQVQVSPLDSVVHSVGEKLSGLLMHRIVLGEISKGDGHALTSDLLDLARLLDPLFLEIGRYAEQHIPGLDVSVFTDRVRDAAEEMSHLICSKIEERHEQIKEEMYYAKHNARRQW